ncbi:hypothetical protein D4R75_10525 [bacterium]|nr:MAG: hypothetical protein D4R75_10525 [bacterium]
MKTQLAASSGDHSVTSRNKKHNSPITNHHLQFSKRSKVMSTSKFFTVALSAVVAIILVSASLFGQNNVTNTGDWTNTGTLKCNSFTNSGASAVFANSGGSSSIQPKGSLSLVSGATAANFDVQAGEVRYRSTAAPQDITASVNLGKYGNLYLIGGQAKNLLGDITVTGKVTSDGASTVLNIGARTLSVTNTGAVPFDSANSGTFNFASGEVSYSGTGSQTVIGAEYGKLTVDGSGTKNLAENVTAKTTLNLVAGALSIGAHGLNINGTYTGVGTLKGGITSNLAVGGSGNITLPAFTVSSDLLNFTFNRYTGVATAYDTVKLAGNLTVNGTLTATAGALQVVSNTLELKAGVTGTANGGFKSYWDGTVYYNGPVDQAVFAAAYGNLQFNNSRKDLTNAGVSIAGTFTPGSAVDHTITGSTITFSGGTGSAQSIPQFNYFGAGGSGYQNIATSGTNKTVGGDLKVAGTFTNGAGITTNVSTYALSVVGTKSQLSDASKMQFGAGDNGVVFTSGIVEYNRAGDQTIKGNAADFYKFLLISGSGTKTISDALSTAIVHTTSDLTISGGLTLAVAPDGNLQVDGNLSNAGIVTNAGAITVGN